MQAPNHILITGGCGFIGSHFVRHVYDAYPTARVLNIDALTYAGNLENLSDIEALEDSKDDSEKRYFFFKGDIADSEFAQSILEKFPVDHIVHFAAETHVDRSYFDISDFLRTNIQGTRVLIEAARTFRPQARFVHISTDEVYGSIEKGSAPEEAPLRPSNLYATSKAAGDLLVQAYVKTMRIPALIVRGSNNFGTHQYPEKLIPLAITNILNHEQIPLHGSGAHIRSWLHVQDFCTAIDAVMSQGEVGEIYNVSGEELTNKEVLDAIGEVLGVSIEEHLTSVADRPGADMRYAPNSDKIQRFLHWKPERTLAHELPEMVKWYTDNEGWWKRIKEKKEYLDHYTKQSKGAWY